MSDGIDVERPNVARMYDAMLGGSHNFAADREAVRSLLAIDPDARRLAVENRAFLGRAVREIAMAGVTQFLDIGSGIPTAGNVHEIVQAHQPDACVVYVDFDPVAVRHGQLILGHPSAHNAVAIHGDLRAPRAITTAPEVLGLLDFDRPVALILAAVLHFVGDEDDPHAIVRYFRDLLPTGSHIAISHATSDVHPALAGVLHDLYGRVGASGRLRTRAEVTAFFDGWDLLDPGVVLTPEWRPEGEPEEPTRIPTLAGVGRKAG